MLNKELYPFKSNYFTINGNRMHYLDEGKGNPIVMVHGNPSWSFYYRNLVTALSKNYRVIVIDHIGMGLSDKPSEEKYKYVAESRLNDLGALIDYLKIKKFTLVGHDWGGIIGSGYASMHPEKIAGMVLFNTSAFHWPIKKKLPFALFLSRLPLVSALFIRGLSAFSVLAATKGIGVNYKLPKDVRAGLLHPYDSWKNRLSVHRFIQDIPMKPSDPMYPLGLLIEARLRLLKDVPKIFLWGMKDMVFCPVVLDEFIRYFPDAEVHKYEDGNHYILEDKIADIIPLVEKFLKDKVTYADIKPAPKPLPRPGYVSLTEHLMTLVKNHPDRKIVAATTGWKLNGKAIYETRTYSQIDKESNRLAHGLWKVGINRGMHVVIMVAPGVYFFSLIVAVLKIGAIPVLIDPGMGMGKLKQCFEEAEPAAFIGIPKAHLGRVLLKWGKKTIKINVTVGRKYLWGGWSIKQILDRGSEEPYILEDAAPEDMAMLAFTSGNTGIPKGVVYTHSIFSAQSVIMKALMNIQGDDIDLSTFPPFALLGPANGMMSVIPDMDSTKPAKADPKKLLKAIQDNRCTNMFASPAIIENLGKYCETNKIKLHTLRRVFSAGAPARMSSIERFLKLLAPGVQIYTPYGATEALPVSVIGSDVLMEETKKITEQGGGVCVGKAVKGMDIAIINITEEPIETWSDKLRLPPNKIGEIAVKGPIVTTVYYKREVQTKLAKILDKKTGEIWHRMGDVGYIDHKGRLWMCGRKNHRVELPDGPLFTLPCEAIYNNHPKVYRSALIGIKKDGRTVPVICIELEKDAKLGTGGKKQLEGELLALGKKHDLTKSIQTLLFHPGFPVDIRHNAKINREILTEWAQKKLSK
jgi:acyl-coenzyme A synthetase/AMP-(fatty) acid ligase/pimeloyl-ACP methyl ester carboxylesterase